MTSKRRQASAGELDFIHSTTRLSVTKLARIFSVTRQTVREWCQGAPLGRHNAHKLDKFARNAGQRYPRPEREGVIRDVRFRTPLRLLRPGTIEK